MSFIPWYARITDIADLIRYNKIVYRTLWRFLVWNSAIVCKTMLILLKHIQIYNNWHLLWSVVLVLVKKIGIIGEQTIDAFGEMYYLANHGSLERSVNLVLQWFIHRHTHFRMCIVFSLYFNSFAYIGEKKDENCTSLRTENSLALLIPNQFVLDDCPRVIVENVEGWCKNGTCFGYFL